MSQSDNSVFFIVTFSIFFISAIGFGFCLVHVFYKMISNIKIYYNFFGKVISTEKKLSFFIKK